MADEQNDNNQSNNNNDNATNGQRNDPPQNQQTSAPPPSQNSSQSNTNTSDLANLTTLIAALPERMAEVVREAMPKNNPSADPPKRNQNTDASDNGNSTNPPQQQTKTDDVPGKQKVRHTLFGIPWL